MAEVHLTFDNGPHPDVTPRVLEVLARRNLRATFFVLGKNLATKAGRDLARRARDEGHRLGNHSYSHEIPLGEDPRPDAVEQELGRTQAWLDQIWDGARWFRPFGGGGVLGPHLLSRDAVDWLVQHRATCVLWNSVPGDWKDPAGWVETALAQAAKLPQDLVVLHDIFPAATAHLDRFLGCLLDAGHAITDTLPAECLPIVEGRPQPGLERCVQP